MTQRILNVKNILRIIISVLIIFSMLKSCAKAVVSLNEIQANIQKIEDAGLLPSGATSNLIASSAWNNQYSDSVAYWAQYRNDYVIAITGTNSQQYANKLFILIGNDVCTNGSNNTNNQLYNDWNFRGCQQNINGTSNSMGQFKLNKASFLYAYSTGGINTRSLQLAAGEELNYNIINIAIDFYYASGSTDTTLAGFQSTFKGFNIDYTTNYFKLGDIDGYTDFNNIQIIMYRIYSTLNQQELFNVTIKENNGSWNYNNNIVAFNGYNGNLSVRTMNLYYAPYYMIIYGKDENGTVLDSTEAYFLFRGQGQAIPAIIGSGDYIGSGDGATTQESSNAITETINNMFTMDNNDIQDLREKISGDMNLGSKIPVGTTIQLLENIQNVQPGDFKISWSSVAYTDKNTQTPIEIIPSGEINFSEKVRNNETAATIHAYTRIIFNGAMGFLILYEIWRCICITLGIGTELYEDYKDENEVITSEHEHVNANTGTITRTTTKRKGRKSASYTRSQKL